MDKNRFETQKEVVNLDPEKHPIQSMFTVEDLKWLIAQAEMVEELEDLLIEADADNTCQAVEIGGLKEKIEELERENEGLRIVLEAERGC